MSNEKIISKIKKVLELSRNNPSKEEATAAAALAQKLMAEYHLELADIEDINNEEEIYEVQVECGKGNKWKYALAGIVAKNFRCKHFYYGKETVIFYGYKTDAEIAAMTFEFLFKFGNKNATNFYQKERNIRMKQYGFFNGDGIKNAYLIGYLEGIQEVLQRQCTALMIITPQEIEDKYSERIKGFNKMKNSGLRRRIDELGNNAREEGKAVGRSIANSRSIENK